MDPADQPEPTLPPAEQMRQKRLAMLNKTNAETSSSTSQSQSQTQSQPSSSTTTQLPKPKQPDENKPPAEKGTKNKSGHMEMMQGGSEPTASAPPAKKINAREEPIEDWSDRILGEMFRITLEENSIADPRGSQMLMLPQLRDDLKSSGEPIKLTAQNIDSAILEAATSIPHSKPLLGTYLFPCFKRVMKTISGLRRPTPERQAVLDEAKRLCMSNCIFALTMPELFGREDIHNRETLVPYLLRSHDSEDGVCLDFFNEAVGRVKEEPETLAIFTDAMVELTSKLTGMNMDDDFKPYVNCLRTYSRYPLLLDALAQHPNFLVQTTPGMTKETLAVSSEQKTILGPFFCLSPLQPEVTKTYFRSPRTIDPAHVKTAQSALQMTLKAHQVDLIAIINAFIRASTAARNRVLDWFAFALNTNHKRRALQVNPKEVASDGFMVNLTVVLDQLCEPFMDTGFSKISKIDVGYFRRNPRVNISDETKLNVDQAAYDAFYEKKAEGTSNFISEVFFLNLAAHHYGSEAANTKLQNLGKDIKHFQKLEKELSEEIPKLNPIQAAQAKRQHEKVISVLEKSMALRWAIEGVLTDQNMQTLSLQFMRYVAVWLLRVASSSAYVPGQKLNLPLPAEQPEEFRCLPEYALQDVCDNFKFISRFMPQVMMSAVGDEIVALCITFLRSSEYIKNPYLKSSLVTLLYTGSFKMYHLSRGVLGDILLGSDFAHEHLLHALMKFYIECEHSGVSTAFYDRFNIRYEIFQVIKVIWPNPIYGEKLRQESRVNRQFFVQFVNLLLNDATYLLDEALGKLSKIHDYQERLKDRTLSAEDREKVQNDLENDERQCQSWMGLVNETMAMMKLFTETLEDAFTMPEIVGRLANMLNYNLDVLVGPKRSKLRVEDATKYSFDPRTLLSEIVDIYLNLSSKKPFIDALAADGRSYKPANFEEASRILGSRNLKSPEELEKWYKLSDQVAKAKEILDQADLDLGEVPSEFEDPIMSILMTDPVILPSKAIVDRSTIVQQLLSDPRDPFNRMPMTIDDVVPADELRAKVEAWRIERIAEAKAKAAGGGDAMDTTAG